MRGKPLKFKLLENGCVIPTTHKLNSDGYFRYHRPGNCKGRKPLVMLHRLVWEKIYGTIFNVSFSVTCRWIREWKV